MTMIAKTRKLSFLLKVAALGMFSLPLILISSASTQVEEQEDLLLKRVNLSGEIAKKKLELERLEERLKEAEGNSLPLARETFKQRLLGFKRAREGVKLAIKNYLEGKQAELEE